MVSFFLDRDISGFCESKSTLLCTAESRDPSVGLYPARRTKIDFDQKALLHLYTLLVVCLLVMVCVDVTFLKIPINRLVTAKRFHKVVRKKNRICVLFQ